MADPGTVAQPVRVGAEPEDRTRTDPRPERTAGTAVAEPTAAVGWSIGLAFHEMRALLFLLRNRSLGSWNWKTLVSHKLFD